MHFFKSLAVTFSLYSIFPMPQFRWEKESMRWVFPCLPLVGAAIGGVMWLWMHLAKMLGSGRALTAAIALLLSIALTGGIHMDGFCDTCDALGSHRSREEKLKILKDPHIGAFGVIGCVLYLLVFFAAWCEWVPKLHDNVLIIILPIVSRSWVALAAVTRKNARGSGLLADVTQAGDRRVNQTLTGIWLAAGLIFLSIWSVSGRWAAAVSGLVTLYFYRMSRREFGGMTGDLAGWYLQMLEASMVLAAALAGGR